MSEFILAHGSYLAIIFVLVLTGTGLPIPEEVPVIAAGMLSAHGQLHPGLALASCLVGALMGDCVMYWIGYHFGRNVVREHPRYAHFVTPEREAKIEQMLQRHGLKVFFLARFMVGIRSPVYLSAGILRVPFRRFLLIDLFCASVVIGTFFGISYYFGPTITQWIRHAEAGLTAVVVLVVGVVAFCYWRRHKRKRAQATPPVGSDEDGSLPSDAEQEEEISSSKTETMA